MHLAGAAIARRKPNAGVQSKDAATAIAIWSHSLQNSSMRQDPDFPCRLQTSALASIALPGRASLARCRRLAAAAALVFGCSLSGSSPRRLDKEAFGGLAGTIKAFMASLAASGSATNVTASAGTTLPLLSCCRLAAAAAHVLGCSLPGSNPSRLAKDAFGGLTGLITAVNSLAGAGRANHDVTDSVRTPVAAMLGRCPSASAAAAAASTTAATLACSVTRRTRRRFVVLDVLLAHLVLEKVRLRTCLVARVSDSPSGDNFLRLQVEAVPLRKPLRIGLLVLVHWKPVARCLWHLCQGCPH